MISQRVTSDLHHCAAFQSVVEKATAALELPL